KGALELDLAAVELQKIGVVPGHCISPRSRRDSAGPGCVRSSASSADLVEMPQHVGRVLVDTVSAGTLQLFRSIAAAQQANAQGPAALRGQHVPDAVAHHHGRLDRYP